MVLTKEDYAGARLRKKGSVYGRICQKEKKTLDMQDFGYLAAFTPDGGCHNGALAGAKSPPPAEGADLAKLRGQCGDVAEPPGAERGLAEIIAKPFSADRTG